MEKKTLLRSSLIVASLCVVLIGIGAPKLRKNQIDTKIAGDAVEMFCAPDATRTFSEYTSYICVVDKRGRAMDLTQVYSTFAANSKTGITVTTKDAQSKVPTEVYQKLVEMYHK